jgi:hypothetical protein
MDQSERSVKGPAERSGERRTWLSQGEEPLGDNASWLALVLIVYDESSVV